MAAAPMTPLREAILLLLCAIGIAVSWRMHRRSILQRRGELHEESVVSSPRARVFFGISNAAIGLVYYAALAVDSFFFSIPAARLAALVAASAAALFSLYLAYSLLFVARAPCRYCWTGHAINWCLLALMVSTFVARR